MISYNNKYFKPVSISENGEVSEEITFHYKQKGNILTCSYTGGNILKGELIGLVSNNGSIDMKYLQINKKLEINSGICQTKLEILPSGKFRLHETWQWTSGEKSKGNSILEEIHSY